METAFLLLCLSIAYAACILKGKKEGKALFFYNDNS